jgi:hypothetical protein
MGALSPRLVVAAALTALVVLPCSVVRAQAAVCGDDSTPPCPLGQTVTPNVVSAPVEGVTVEVHGSGLALVTSARLQPGGAATAIIGRSDTSLALRLPDGLGAGSYQVELAIAGQTQGFSTTPFFQVADPSAARGLPHFTFAPTPPPGKASATNSVPSLTPFGATGSGSSSWASIVRVSLVVLAAGAIGGGLVTALYLVIRRRREIRLHELTYAAMDRHLEKLWSTDERRVGGTAPEAPNPTPPSAAHDREPSSTPRY